MTHGYTEHPVFPTPPSPEAKLWRYIDFAKFVALLHYRALFFSRLDYLGDPFEGYYSPVNVALAPQVYGARCPPEQLPMVLASIDRMRAWTRDIGRRFTAVSCWHLNSHESDAMWRLYAERGSGIALQSTFRRLTSSFSPSCGRTVYAGCVTYLDYDQEYIPESNAMSVFMHKRISFVHEAEVRAVICELPSNERPIPELPEPGLNVAVDLSQLVERVVISPTAPSWFAQLVESVAARYELPAPVVQSQLAVLPPY